MIRVILFLFTLSTVNLVFSQNSYAILDSNCSSLALDNFNRYRNELDTLPFKLIGIGSEKCDTLSLISRLMSVKYFWFANERVVHCNKPIDRSQYMEIYFPYEGPNMPSHRTGVRVTTYPTEAVKLFFIYGLFKSNFYFTDSIALHKKSKVLMLDNAKVGIFEANVNSSNVADDSEEIMKELFINYDLIKEAERSYRKWFKKLERFGMAEMRKRGWHPLYWSDLQW